MLPAMQRRNLVVGLCLLLGIGATLGGLAYLRGDGRGANVGLATGANGLEVAEVEGPPSVQRGSRPVNVGEAIPGRYRVKFDRRGLSGVRLVGGKLAVADAGLTTSLSRLGNPQAAYRFAAKQPVGEALGLAQTWEVESDDDLATLRAELEGKPGVEWVEPVFLVRSLANPNDPYYSLQWDLDALNHATFLGNDDGTDVVVAVIDSGVSVGSDGYSHLGAGYDFFANDSDASDSDAVESGFSHGTHVAGTIAESTNNGVGAAGLAPGVTIMPVRVLGLDPSTGSVSGSDADVASGIVWAVDNGADVINMSLGGEGYSSQLADACDYAWENGVVVVAASGNDGYDDGVLYPAALPTVIAVGAVDRGHTLTYYSNGGPELDIVAPGGDNSQDLDQDGNGDGILQESNGMYGWNYYISTGTSMASPHVAAAAALLVARGYATPADVTDALTGSAGDLGANGRDDAYGSGELNVVAALALTVPDDAEPEEDGGDADDPGADDEPEGDDGDANGGGGDDEDGPIATLAVSDLSAAQASEGRLSITWQTNLPATTQLTGDDDYADEVYLTAHTVFALGEVGDDATYTVRSVSEDGQTAEGTISASFEGTSAWERPDSGGCASVPWGGGIAGILGAVAMLRRRAGDPGRSSADGAR